MNRKTIFKNFKFIIMKKLVLGIFATVFASSLSFGQFDKIGLEHNEQLTVLVKNADKSVTRENVFDISQALINSTFPQYRDTPAYRFADYTSPSKMTDELLSKRMISKELHTQVNKDIVNVSKLTGYVAVQAYVENAKSNTKTLPVSDHPKYLDFLSVMKHSAYFWDEAGFNGAALVPRTPAVSARFNPWKYLACDAVGALGGPASMAIASICYGIAEW